MGTQLHFNTVYHPQSDRESEWMIQILEDIRKSCILDFGGRWDTYLLLAEFSYNNNYHSNINKPSSEMLYGKKYQTPICWSEARKNFTRSTMVAL